MAKNNTRHQCQDCLQHAMSKEKTAKTPRLMHEGLPFCVECAQHWECAEVEVPSEDRKCSRCDGAGVPEGWEDHCPMCKGTGKHTIRAYVAPTFKCLECGETMPMVKNSSYGYALDWRHDPSCGALYNKCACGVRNKRPGQRRCSPCTQPVYRHLAAEAKKDETPKVNRRQYRGRVPRNPHVGEEMGPSQENAMRAREDG